jgi:hypothetical protein
LQAVSETYDDFDTGRVIVERALGLSSEELHAANAELRGVLQVLPDLLFRVRADDRICGVMQGSSVLDQPALRSLRESPSPDGSIDCAAILARRPAGAGHAILDLVRIRRLFFQSGALL